jgi:hypothetical protein
MKRPFHDKDLLYLFSYDLELATHPEDIGLVPGGARTNVYLVPEDSRVYHVLRERAIGGLGFPVITGTIVWGADWALLRDDDVAISDVRLLIRTDDGALIDSTYSGVCPLGIGGFRGIVNQDDKLGKPEAPFVATVVTTPRFLTSAPKYNWLNEQQCVGFGRLEVVKGVLRRVSYDIYAMT